MCQHQANGERSFWILLWVVTMFTSAIPFARGERGILDKVGLGIGILMAVILILGFAFEFYCHRHPEFVEQMENEFQNEEEERRKKLETK